MIGLSCMANLLPFTMLAMRASARALPGPQDRAGRRGLEGGRGEDRSRRFPWIDVICRGEAERTGPELLAALRARRRPGAASAASRFRGDGRDRPHARPAADHRPRLHPLPGVREGGPDALRRLRHDDQPRLPLSLHVLLGGPGVEPGELLAAARRTSSTRWNICTARAGVDLFLFQDEFFVSGKRQVMEFCGELAARGAERAVEGLRAGEPGGRGDDAGDGRLRLRGTAVRHRVGLRPRVAGDQEGLHRGRVAGGGRPRRCPSSRRVDAFFVWGFPFETMEDFHQSLFQMVSFRMLGARILPSLLSLLPQTEIYREWSRPGDAGVLPLPAAGVRVHRPRGLPRRADRAARAIREYFELILANPDIFPRLLPHRPGGQRAAEAGVAAASSASIPSRAEPETKAESCGAHSPADRAAGVGHAGRAVGWKPPLHGVATTWVLVKTGGGHIGTVFRNHPACAPYGVVANRR